MIVVFDTNVIVEGIFWPRSTARRALTGLARRRFKPAVNAAILEEYSAITTEVRARLFPAAQPSGALAWIASKSIQAEPVPLAGKLASWDAGWVWMYILAYVPVLFVMRALLRVA